MGVFERPVQRQAGSNRNDFKWTTESDGNVCGRGSACGYPVEVFLVLPGNGRKGIINGEEMIDGRDGLALLCYDVICEIRL